MVCGKQRCVLQEIQNFFVSPFFFVFFFFFSFYFLFCLVLSCLVLSLGLGRLGVLFSFCQLFCSICCTCFAKHPYTHILIYYHLTQK